MNIQKKRKSVEINKERDQQKKFNKDKRKEVMTAGI